ncbi:MAG: hypothetical protein KY451_09000 [Actinobacteria bacterium]|nr:hypothetical protein [Actinomycetota bacterium]
MTSSRDMDDARAERILLRRGAGASVDHDPASAFVAAIADLGKQTPAPTGALAALLADGFEPETGTATAPADRLPGRRGWLADLPLRVKVLAGAGVALVSLATAATAGVLPDPLQERVEGVLEAVTPFEFPSVTDPATPTRTPDEGDTTPDTEAPVLPDPGPPPAPAGPPAPADPPAPAEQPAPPAVPAPVPVPVPGPLTPTDTASPPPGRPDAPRGGTAPDAPGQRPDAPRQDAPRRVQPPAGAAAADAPAEPGSGSFERPLQQDTPTTIRPGAAALAPAPGSSAGQPSG